MLRSDAFTQPNVAIDAWLGLQFISPQSENNDSTELILQRPPPLVKHLFRLAGGRG
jgi:hypothetical protein